MSTKSLPGLFCILILTVLLGCQSVPKAKLEFADGSYEGEVNQDGLKHGTGIYRWLDGSIYEGYYKNDLRHGQGKFLWANGEGYEGAYLEDIRTGKGRYTWPDGSFYEGDFLSGKRHGFGKFTAADLSTYEGEWFDDLQHGQGTLTSQDKKVLQGIWREGVLLTKPAQIPKISPQPNLPSLSLPEPVPLSVAPKEDHNLSKPQNFAIPQKIGDDAPSSTNATLSETTNSQLSSPKEVLQDNKATQTSPEESSEANNPLTPSTKTSVEISKEDEKDDELGPADWVGTKAEAEATFETFFIDGFDTILDRLNGVPFSGRMRVLDEDGNAKGEVNFLNGRLHGEEIFYNGNGDVVERNFWSNGRPALR